MMNQQASPTSNGNQVSWMSGLFLLICRALALSVEVFLHRTGTFGERYLGLQSGVAALLILLYPAFGEREDPRPLLVFLGCYLVMLQVVRVRTWWRSRRGTAQPHSFFTGTPRLMRLLGKVSEAKIKSLIEPTLVFFIGMITMYCSKPLGSYLMLASIGLFLTMDLALGFERKRAIDMHDSLIDQQNVAERFRRMRGD